MTHKLRRSTLETCLKLFVVPYFICAAPKARRSLHQFRTQLYKLRHKPRTKKICANLRSDYVHFLSFASTLVDRLYASQGGLTVTQVDQSEAKDIVHFFRNQTDGGVIASAHFGCLDVVSQAYTLWEGNRKIVPMEYHAHDGLSTAKVLGQQTRTIDLFEVRKRITESNEIFCFLADRPAQTQIEMTTFLGSLAYFDAVPFRLAIMCGCPLLAMVAVKVSPNTYKTFAKRLDPIIASHARSEVLHTLIEDYVRFLEQVVVRYPESWFNFYYYFSQLPWNPYGPLWPKVRGRVSYPGVTHVSNGKMRWKQISQPSEHRI